MFNGHDPYLVALSVVIASLGGYTGFGLAARIRAMPGASRRLLLAGAAGFLAVGVWAMHFIGMLAAPLPLDAGYLLLPTIASFLLCALVGGVSVVFVTIRHPPPFPLATPPPRLPCGAWPGPQRPARGVQARRQQGAAGARAGHDDVRRVPSRPRAEGRGWPATHAGATGRARSAAAGACFAPAGRRGRWDAFHRRGRYPKRQGGCPLYAGSRRHAGAHVPVGDLRSRSTARSRVLRWGTSHAHRVDPACHLHPQGRRWRRRRPRRPDAPSRPRHS